MGTREWLLILVAGVLGAFVVSSHLPRAQSPSTIALDTPLKGLAFRSPKVDSFGKPIPAGKLTVVALPPCTSCAMKSLRPKSIRAKAAGPIVWLIDGSKADALAYKDISGRDDYRMCKPFTETLDPKILFHLPAQFVVSAQGVIEDEIAFN